MSATAASASPAQAAALNPRTRRLLQDPILPTLLRLAVPNLLIMLAQASTGLIETWWISHLGTDALAGMALVFPPVMLMQMLSAGAVGGGISSAVARALGAGRRDTADGLVLHAVVINLALGLAFSALMLGFGRPIYGALGGEGAALEAALTYSTVVFLGNPLLWLMNGLASVIRGTGNMLVPALVICAGDPERWQRPDAEDQQRREGHQQIFEPRACAEPGHGIKPGVPRHKGRQQRDRHVGLQ